MDEKKIILWKIKCFGKNKWPKKQVQNQDIEIKNFVRIS